jgi:hypothetical protein
VTTVLVAYGSKHGSTAEIAAAIRPMPKNGDATTLAPVLIMP